MACVQWLREHDYRYLVVMPRTADGRQFDALRGRRIARITQSNQTVHLHKVVSTDPEEVAPVLLLRGAPPRRNAGIVERFATRFETALTQLHEGLDAPPHPQTSSTR